MTVFINRLYQKAILRTFYFLLIMTVDLLQLAKKKYATFNEDFKKAQINRLLTPYVLLTLNS